jgi:hypothetical protein
MVRKLFCFVLLLGLVSNVSAIPANDVWTNNMLDRDWMNPGNWSLGVVPGPGTGTTQIGGSYLGYPIAGPIIGVGDNASTGDYETMVEGQTLDIQGGSFSGPAFDLNAEGYYDDNPAIISLGQFGTGGSISILNILLGDTWYYHGAPYVEYNQWSGTCIVSDWIWLGGKMNLYGGYTKATNGMNVAASGMPNTLCTLTIYGGCGGKLSLPGDWGSDPDPNNPITGVDIVNGWIANGYLVAAGDSPGPWHIRINLDEEPGRIVLTSVPEPATIALLCLGGMALIRRKRS